MRQMNEEDNVKCIYRTNIGLLSMNSQKGQTQRKQRVVAPRD